MLGRRLGIAELADVTSRPRDRLERILDQLVRMRLVVEEDRAASWPTRSPIPSSPRSSTTGSAAAGAGPCTGRRDGRCSSPDGRPRRHPTSFGRADPGDAEAIEALTEALRQAERREADREALEILAGLVEILPSSDPRWADVAATMSWHADWVVDHRADNLVVGVRAIQEMNAAAGPVRRPGRPGTIRLRLASFLAWGTGDTAAAERICREALALFDAAGDEPRADSGADRTGLDRRVGRRRRVHGDRRPGRHRGRRQAG